MKGGKGRAKRKGGLRRARLEEGRVGGGGGERRWQLEMEREKNLEIKGEKGRPKGRREGGGLGGRRGGRVPRGVGRRNGWRGVGHQPETEKGGGGGGLGRRGRKRKKGSRGAKKK